MAVLARSNVVKAVRLNKDFQARMRRVAEWLIKDSRMAPSGTLSDGATIRLLLEEGLRAVEQRKQQDHNNKPKR